MANEEKIVEVTEDVVEETGEVIISTKEALRAIGHNAKVKTKETWEKAKPRLKKVAIVGGVVLGAAYLINKNSEAPALEQKDDEWVDDDIVDGNCIVTETAAEEAGTVETEVADTNATE